MEWLEDVEKTLDEADPSSEALRWGRRCIYRVPACIKELNPKAYRPQLVSLGPFHHGDAELQPMEEHKRRALQHLLRRASAGRRRRPLMKDLVASVQDAAEQLEGAYGDDLAAEWRGGELGRKRFVAMMVLDGCFLLEVTRAAATTLELDGKHTAGDDYAPNDPIFSSHGVLYVVPYIRRDMLMLENQLPLLLLHKLVAVVETAKQPTINGDDVINRMVLKFLSPSPRTGSAHPGLHALDGLRRSMLYGQYQAPSSRRLSVSAHAPEETTTAIRSAVELYEAGIRFRRTTAASSDGIRFRDNVLSMPAVVVDDSTEYTLLNMMAFERLHVGAGNDVTSNVFFMYSVIDSARDVALLSASGIIENAIGSDKAVAKLFDSICKDVVLEPDNRLFEVHRQVNAYCTKPWNMWRANVNHVYLRSPTSCINFLAAAVALILTVTQTVYTIMSFYNQLSSSARQPEASATNK